MPMFVLVLEGFSHMVGKAFLTGLLPGFSVGCLGRGSLTVSHLLFANATLVLYEVAQGHLFHLQSILIWFEAASGLRINFNKSVLVPVGEMPSLGVLADILGCQTAQLLLLYLRLPLEPVMEQMERRLAGWKCIYLSKGESANFD